MTPGVVIVAYRIPGNRVREHLCWNGPLYQHARLFLVVDQLWELPDYATSVIFPEENLPLLHGRRVFSPGATRNFGIQAALAAGCDPILAADIDIVWPPSVWPTLIDFPCDRIRIPLCCMRTYYDRPDRQDHWDEGATGSVAMHAEHWRQFRYDERLVGYSCDDGLLMVNAKRNGLLCDGSGYVWHIAHEPGINPRRTGRGYLGCWNRDDFNPDNFDRNYPFHQEAEQSGHDTSRDIR